MKKRFLIEGTELCLVFDFDRTGEGIKGFYVYGQVGEFLKLNLISDEYKGHEGQGLAISSDCCIVTLFD